MLDQVPPDQADRAGRVKTADGPSSTSAELSGLQAYSFGVPTDPPNTRSDYTGYDGSVPVVAISSRKVLWT